MQPLPTPIRRPWLAALLLACAGTAAAAPADAAEARYRQDHAACLDGRSPQDRATCLKEAGAALAEARRRTLDNGETPAQLRANALQRCQRVADADRAACERMAQGGGQRSGSVAEGAVVTQITTRTVGTPAAAAAAADAPASAASR